MYINLAKGHVIGPISNLDNFNWNMFILNIQNSNMITENAENVSSLVQINIQSFCIQFAVVQMHYII